MAADERPDDSAGHHGERVVPDQLARMVRSDNSGRGISSTAEDRRTPLGAMGIGGEEVHAPVPQQAFGAFLCGSAELSSHAHRRYLDIDATLDKVRHHRRPRLQLGVPFRMYQNRPHSVGLQTVEKFIRADGHRHGGELHQHVVFAVQFVDPVCRGLLGDFVRHVDLVAGQHAQPLSADGFLEGGDTVQDFSRFRIVGYAVEHVRRAAHPLNAIRLSDARHFERFVKSSGAIIHLGQACENGYLIMTNPDILARFHAVRFDLCDNRLLQHVYTKDKTSEAFFSHQDALTTLEGPGFHANLAAYL